MAEVTNKQDGPQEATKSAKQEAEAKKIHEPKHVAQIEVDKKRATEDKAEQKAAKVKEEKKAAKTATAKDDKKEEKKREIVLERVYTVNLRDAYRKPKYKRADTATLLLKQFLARHLHVPRGGTVKISPEVNEYLRARGSVHPVKRVKVQANKDKEGLVWANLVR